MNLSQLIARARRTHRTEGLKPTIDKSLRFIPRYCRHVLGVNGLYGNPLYRNLLRWWNSRPHSVVAVPFKTVRVDPSEITYVTGRGPNPGRFQWQDLGKIQDGNWDRSDQRVEDLPVVQALRERFEDGKSWEETEFIQHVLEQAEHGNVIWRGCTNEEDVQEACARVDRLYESIRENGYRSKRELVEQEDVSQDKYVEGDRFNRYDEVVVDIGRGGEVLFVDGRHRLAIARILSLEKIPVRISTRHKQWQQIREAIVELPQSDLPEKIEQQLDHPDMRDLRGENTSSS